MPTSVATSTAAGPGAGEEFDPTVTDRILDEHARLREDLIAVLLDVQEEMGYLPPVHLQHIATSIDVPLSQVYGIVTFYKCFRLVPPGRHQITCCMGTACHVRGAPNVLRELRTRLGIESGEVTEDRAFGLETVNCVGACALGPVLIVDESYQGHMTAMKVPGILRKILKADQEAGGIDTETAA
jgi:NADH-quinone oxidoreductase subunit E